MKEKLLAYISELEKSRLHYLDESEKCEMFTFGSEDWAMFKRNAHSLEVTIRRLKEIVES